MIKKNQKHINIQKKCKKVHPKIKKYNSNSQYIPTIKNQRINNPTEIQNRNH